VKTGRLAPLGGGGRPPARSRLMALCALAGALLFFVPLWLTGGATIHISLKLCVEVGVVPVLLLFWNAERRRK
jgi:hypothetical protein